MRDIFGIIAVTGVTLAIIYLTAITTSECDSPKNRVAAGGLFGGCAIKP